VSSTRSTTSYTDEFPEPSYTVFDRQRDSREVRPYVHPDTGLAPQEDFLAGPEGDAAISSDASNHVIISGLGAGKTTTLIMRAWANAERWNRGELGAIIAPDWPTIKNAILPTMREFGLLEVCDYVGPGGEEPGVHTPSGSRIILQTASNERKIRRLRGPNLAWVGIDEPASLAERAWEVLSGRLRVGNYRNAFLTGTPRGFNWVYDRFYEDDAEIVHDDVYEIRESDRVRGVFGVPSWLNPHNPDDYIERLKDEYSGSYYEQEVEGSFTQFEGLVYPWFDRDEHIRKSEDLPDSWDETIFGVDWGFSNHAAIVAILIHGDRWYVVEERKSRRMGNNDIAAELEQMEDDYGSGPVYCDSAEPKSIEALNENGFDARKSDKSVEEGIKAVAAKRDELRVHDLCQETINEFHAYQYKDGRESEKPKKENDHIMDALRYAIFTHETQDTVQIRFKSGSMPSNGSIR
jgi:Phage terminase large subunit